MWPRWFVQMILRITVKCGKRPRRLYNWAFMTKIKKPKLTHYRSEWQQFMASIGLQAVFYDVRSANSDETVERRIDQFQDDLEQEGKRYGWPAEKIAAQKTKLRVMLVTAAQREESSAVRLNFQTAIDRLDE
jgi:hypothetical protein